MADSPKIQQMTRRQLYRQVWNRPLSTVAEEIGMSTNGLAKICDRMAIPYPPRGYWARARAGRPLQRPALPPDNEADASPIIFSEQKSPSRRNRSRLTPDERREQLLGLAHEIIVAEGVHAASMKRLARQAGISEAMAHNYFSRDELLIELARRELESMERSRQSDIERGADARTRALLGTVRYLQEVDRRGALIQVLLTSPVVRESLRQERKTKSAAGTARLSEGFAREYGVPRPVSERTSRVLTAVSLRAGRLLAQGCIDLQTAENLLIPLISAGHASMIRKWGAGKRRAGALPE